MKNHISRHHSVISRCEVLLACCSQTNITDVKAANVPISEILCNIHVHRICDDEPICYKLQTNTIILQYKTKTVSDSDKQIWADTNGLRDALCHTQSSSCCAQSWMLRLINRRQSLTVDNICNDRCAIAKLFLVQR